MSKKNEPARPEARLPKGLFDTGAEEIRATERMLATIREVFESYGFEPFDTPAIEYSDALGKFLPDQDRPNVGVFSFQDDDERWLSLRYDLTAPLARYVAENYQTLPKPFRRYQVGPVWRNEKPGPGRFRQFTQFDADTVGASSVAADAEMCMLTADTLEALGVKRGQYVVRINSRKILDGVLELIELGGDDNAGKRLTVMRAIDKWDRLGEDGVRALLGSGRKDESGDFTKGAGLSSDQVHEILTFVASTSAVDEHSEDLTDWELQDSIFAGGSVEPGDQPGSLSFVPSTYSEPGAGRLPITNRATIRKLRAHFGDTGKVKEGLDELEQIANLAHAAHYGTKRIRIDPSVVRGLEYYTGPVFEAELTAPIKDERGKPIRLGSVVSGGRYDGLVERFTGQTVPATGVSIGVSRLLIGLKALGKIGAERASGPVVVLVLDRDRLADYQQMAQTLRSAGIRAEMYLGESGMKAQMKYADKRGAPCVVIQGSDEKEKGEVQIKDLILGATLTAIKDRDEYLKKQAEAQFPVPQGKLVEAVRGVLSRHKA